MSTLQVVMYWSSTKRFRVMDTEMETLNMAHTKNTKYICVLFILSHY